MLVVYASRLHETQVNHVLGPGGVIGTLAHDDIPAM